VSGKGVDARTVAVTAIMIAVVAVSFAAFAFGPWIGLIAGGVGGGLADIIGGYALYAPLTFLAHGLEDLVVGCIGRR
jgi:uncharacterized membrane protein